MTSRRCTVLLLIVLAIATVAACDSTADSELASWSGESGSSYARLLARNEGVLALVNGCVVLENRLGDEQTIVFPADVTTFDGKAVKIRGKSFPLGSRVVMGGGSYGNMPSSWSVPATCPRDNWWATGDLDAE